jgi:uncharacterized protein YkwD/uncharacterized membrane protein required for colicin V production
MPNLLSALSNATLVDAVVVVVIGLYVLEDMRNGMLWGLVQLLGLLLALFTGLLLYPSVSDWLVGTAGLAYALAKPIGFAGIWLVTDLIYSVTVRRLTDLSSREVAKTRSGQVLGAVTGLARGLLVATLGLAVVVALPLPDPITSAIHDSHVAEPLAARGENVQRALGGVFGDAVQESIGLLTVHPESSERVDLPFKVPSPTIDPTAEGRLFDLVNQARADNGVQPLVLDESIRQVARANSVAMFQQGYFAHIDPNGVSPFDRMRNGDISFRAAGENLALAPTVDVAHDGLMNSPGHRANILNPAFHRIGIGVADGGMHGKMFTQNFAD